MNNSSIKPAAISVGLVGSSGYSGQALGKILSSHPNVSSITCFYRSQDVQNIESAQYLPIEELASACHSLDVVFLATPAETSMSLVACLLKSDTHVIDLSGAFRLNAEAYAHWYEQEHSAAEYLQQAIYGLSPYQKSGSSHINAAALISNPGCYASCSLITLLPLLKHKLIKPEHIVIDAKSGVSGAGKKIHENLMFMNINENFYPYRINKHQHIPEIIRYAEYFSGISPDIIFNTHLLPINRGLAISLYAKLNARITLSDVSAAYQAQYGEYDLVKFCSSDNQNQTQQLSQLKNVCHTPHTHIVFSQQSGWLTVFACLDNLLKGAASQAVENFNHLFGLPTTTGLLNT